MAGKQASGRNQKKVGKKSRKNVISQADKKRSKLKVDQINKEFEMVADILAPEPEKAQKQESNSLEAKKLMKDNQNDRATLGKIAKAKQKTDNDLVNQIEMISGFSF